MNWLGHVAMKWVMALLNLVACGLILLLIPDWPLRLIILAVFGLYVTWVWLTQEQSYARLNPVRPLTRHDVPDYAAFRQRLTQACDEAGLRREPVWAVHEDDSANAMAVGGTRGVVVFTTALLKQFPPDEILAVAGHELKHLASRDTLPAVLGSAWFHMVGTISYWFQQAGHRSPGIIATLALLVAAIIDVALVPVSWLVGIFLAKRSRHAEHLADLAGARLTSPGTMVSALRRLGAVHPPKRKYPAWSAAWLAQRLYASHPPVEERIAWLTAAAEGGAVRE